ncbi:hypothetical protein Sjap_016322 [Stephania japonica]|uniref:Uncharacterized protein n=1 Tax=Stephania japonica TaxID=461633 RepID=A0AAP0ILQ3_9MAGN
MRDAFYKEVSPQGIKDGLKRYVYMWHALAGYWGGLLPTAEAFKKYNPKIVYPVQSPGNLGNIRDIAMDSLEKYRVGLIDPSKIHDFYNDLHSYLVKRGVDGRKVDVQNVLETLGSGHGGRVSLSKHVTAEFHGSARAVGGCSVYVSDKPGIHDFDVLKRLVHPDGSALRARYAGRPTRDCLFKDPVMDGESLLKIWNLNKFSGVVGVFNCQGAGTWPCKKNPCRGPISGSRKNSNISGYVSPMDVEFLEEIQAKIGPGTLQFMFLTRVIYHAPTSFCICNPLFSFIDLIPIPCVSESLHRLPKNGGVKVSLSILQSEICTISPIQEYNKTIQFAPIGLIDMYNSGGAIKGLNRTADP